MKAHIDIYGPNSMNSIFQSERSDRSGSSFRVSRIPPFVEERRT